MRNVDVFAIYLQSGNFFHAEIAQIYSPSEALKLKAQNIQI